MLGRWIIFSVNFIHTFSKCIRKGFNIHDSKKSSYQKKSVLEFCIIYSQYYTEIDYKYKTNNIITELMSRPFLSFHQRPQSSYKNIFIRKVSSVDISTLNIVTFSEKVTKSCMILIERVDDNLYENKRCKFQNQKYRKF